MGCSNRSIVSHGHTLTPRSLVSQETRKTGEKPRPPAARSALIGGITKPERPDQRSGRAARSYPGELPPEASSSRSVHGGKEQEDDASRWRARCPPTPRISHALAED